MGQFEASACELVGVLVGSVWPPCGPGLDLFWGLFLSGMSGAPHVGPELNSVTCSLSSLAVALSPDQHLRWNGTLVYSEAPRPPHPACSVPRAFATDTLSSPDARCYLLVSLLFSVRTL